MAAQECTEQRGRNSTWNKEHIRCKTPTLLFGGTVVPMCLLPLTNSVVAFAQHWPRGWSAISEIGDIPDWVHFVLLKLVIYISIQPGNALFEIWWERRKMQRDLRVLNLQVWSSALKLETLFSDNHHNRSFCIVYSQHNFNDNTFRRLMWKCGSLISLEKTWR